MFGHFTGILLASTLWFIMYSIFRRNKPQVYPKVILPALASGIMWGIAMGKPICIHLPIYPSLHLYIRVYLLIHISISSPLHPCISIDTYVHLFTSKFYIHVYLSIHISIPLYKYLFTYTSYNPLLYLSLLQLAGLLLMNIYHLPLVFLLSQL